MRTVRFTTLLLSSSLLALGLVGATVVPAHAADHPVSDTASLVTALTNAVDGDTVTFTSDITLNADPPIVNSQITLDGAGFTLDGASNAYNGLTFQNTSATVTDLTITAPDGSGISAIDADLVVEGVTVTSAGEAGVLVTNSAGGNTVVVSDSTFTNCQHGIFSGVDGGSITATDVVVNDNLSSGLTAYQVGASTAALTRVTATGNGTDGVSATVDGGTVSLSDVVTGLNTLGGVDIVASGATSHVSLNRVTAADNDGIGLYLVAYQDAAIEATQITSLSNGLGASDENGVTVVALNGGEVAITDAVIGDNGEHGLEFVLGDTGGGFAPGTLTLTRADIVGNHGIGLAGAAQPGSLAAVRESSIHANPLGVDLGTAAGDVEDAEIRIERSTVWNNEIGMETVLSDGAVLGIVNSTLSGNQDPGSPVIRVDGQDTASFSLRHSTVSDNVGSDIVEITGGDALISHSILGGNTVASNDLLANSAVIAVEYSLVETIADPGTQTAVAAGPGNLTGVAPVLGSLADNGGWTMTHVPQAGSPAIDAGNTSIAGAPATDQRGEARVQGAAIDIGAVEQEGDSDDEPPSKPVNPGVTFQTGRR